MPETAGPVVCAGASHGSKTGANMKRTIMVLTLFLVSLSYCQEAKTPAPPKYWPIQIGGMLFTRMELAMDNQTRARGLMNRKELPEDGGMLFLFRQEKLQSFWMKDTLIPLDIVFLDAKGTITAIHTMKVEPRRRNESDERYGRRLRPYSSVRPAIAAIELNAGMAESLGLRPGAKIETYRTSLVKFIK